MPKNDGIGYGQFTPLKLEHFSKILSYHLRITQAVLHKNKNYYPQIYNYIDLTAGCGSTPNGLKGCALTFIEIIEAEEIDLAMKAIFIECNEKHIQQLENNLKSFIKVEKFFYHGKYQELLPKIITKKNNEFGLVFIDPSGEIPDFQTLQYIAEKRPKMELLIYLSSTNVKRIFQYKGKKLKDYLLEIQKKYWLIRKSYSGDKHKWTFILGSNASDLFKDYKKIDFYKMESEIGQKILKELNLTEKERFNELQPSLFNDFENEVTAIKDRENGNFKNRMD